jgi:hypothetical protein
MRVEAEARGLTLRSVKKQILGNQRHAGQEKQSEDSQQAQFYEPEQAVVRTHALEPSGFRYCAGQGENDYPPFGLLILLQFQNGDGVELYTG